MIQNQKIKFAKEVIFQEINALKKLSKSYNANFIKAIDLIQKCKGKVICVGMGKSGHIIRKISATLSSVGVPSIYLHPSEAAHGDLGACNPKQDCFLIMSYSGNTDELKSILNYAHKFKMPIIGVASRENSTLINSSTIKIVLPKVKEAGLEPAQASSVKTVAWTQRLRETLSAPGPWWVALCFAMYSGQWLAVVGFLPSIYTQAGLLGATLGSLTAFAAAVNMVGNMASGRLLQKGIHPSVLLAMGFLAMGAGAFLSFAEFTQSWPWLRYAGVLLFSACGGLVPGTLFSLAVRLAPHERNVSTTVGWMQQGSAAGQFAGPPLVAWLASQVGGWQWTWLATGLCCVLGGLLSLLIARTLSQQSVAS